MARPKKHDGILYRRGRFWWMRYRDRDGTRRLESTGATDWQEAQTRLRKRLQARDENVLALVRRGQQLTFNEWADFFLEHYSQPPFRSTKTHAANQNALKQLKPCSERKRWQPSAQRMLKSTCAGGSGNTSASRHGQGIENSAF